MPTSAVKPRQSHRIGGNQSAGDARFTTRPFAGIASLLVVAALFLSLNITPVVDGPINIALVVVAAIVAVAALFAAALATRGQNDAQRFGFAEVGHARSIPRRREIDRMDNMARIVRVWKGYGTADGVQQYCDHHFTKTVLPQWRALEGFLSANVLVRSIENETEVIVATVWDSIDSVKAFAGEDHHVAVVEPIVRNFLDRFDDRVTHFTVAVAT